MIILFSNEFNNIGMYHYALILGMIPALPMSMTQLATYRIIVDGQDIGTMTMTIAKAKAMTLKGIVLIKVQA